MNRKLIFLILFYLLNNLSYSQDFGDFPEIEKEKLLNDLDLLYQGLDKFHSGMYWYTPKDSVDSAFKDVKSQINKDLNILEFHKLIAPLIALSRESHTNVYLSESTNQKIVKEASFIPLTFVFLGAKLYCVYNGSIFQDLSIEGKEIESINGERPIDIVNKIGNLFASDGYIEVAKFNGLEGFDFSKYYFYYYGNVSSFNIKFKNIEKPIIIKSLKINEISENFSSRNAYHKFSKKELLEYKILNNSTAYLGIHSFSDSDIKEESKGKNIKIYLKNSFKSIAENDIKKSNYRCQ